MTRELLKSWTKNDFDIQWFSGTGAGGQHRNKHQNCVRIVHRESGITTTGQNHRSRDQNFREAFREMALRLREHYYPVAQKPRAPVEDVIRTYNIPDNRVKDHASGLTDSFDSFNMDEMIRARKGAT